MPIKDSGQIQQIVDALRAEIIAISVKGVTSACEDVASRAQGYAPVGRGHQQVGKSFAVQARPESAFEGKARRQQSRLLSEIAANPEGVASLIRRSDKIGRKFGVHPARTLASRFASKERVVAKKGGSTSGKGTTGITPHELRVGPRGGLRGVRFAEPGGALRASIHVRGVEVLEDRVTGHVGSDLPYAAAMEYGFHHFSHGKASGGFVAAPRGSYLRKAGKEVGEQIANYFRE